MRCEKITTVFSNKVVNYVTKTWRVKIDEQEECMKSKQGENGFDMNFGSIETRKNSNGKVRGYIHSSYKP